MTIAEEHSDRQGVRADFQRSVGFLLAKLGVRATRSWAAMLTDLGLTPHAHAVLLTLRDHGALSLTDLATAIGVDPRNMGPVLDAMPTLVERGSDPADRRRRTVTLTDLGRATADHLAHAAAGIEDRFLQVLTQDERRQLGRLLLKIDDSRLVGSQVAESQ